ncbi:MAG: transglycosylase SLT domain-containing protein [Pseudomonadota bacterium]|nr:transglycosylase SLT domain-containing protein [Pseudomonadota bacterium]
MNDCDADPRVAMWARRFTRNPEGFESRLQALLPRLVYVQKVASQHGVAGEFALMPWVESRFQPVSGERHRAAGMWQIMPITAGAMGLRVDGHYDGRLDIAAAAEAVMTLLARYYEQFQDWRIADYAYNAGEFGIRRIIDKHGMPPAQPAIPKWPVRRGTREHLTKLLAIACVVREPSRFNVTLPTLPEEQRLVKVDIPHSMSLSKAADHAGLAEDVLKHLNSAFRGKLVDSKAVSYLMLPASHAEQFQNATQSTIAMRDANRPPALGVRANVEANAPLTTHTVRSGDSLWEIARNYHVKVTELKRWNHLQGSTLKPGQVLRVGTD